MISTAARSNLDTYILALARFGDDLTLDDFRTKAIEAAKRTAIKVRRYVTLGSIFFLLLTLSILVAQVWLRGAEPSAAMLSAAAWSFALGGLGAVASIFLHLLKMLPQQSFNASDEFEVIGRIVLGCLFSTILSITLVPNVREFFAALENPKMMTSATTGPLALLPFLLGYSIPLVLRILEKVIQAVELTIGAEDRRAAIPTVRSQSRARRRVS